MSIAVENAKLTTAFLCPMYQSAKYTCDRPAVHLVNGTAICNEHAKRLELFTHNLKQPTGERRRIPLTKSKDNNYDAKHHSDITRTIRSFRAGFWSMGRRSAYWWKRGRWACATGQPDAVEKGRSGTD